LGEGLEALNEDTTSFTGCCLTSWTGGANWAGAGLLPEQVTEEGGRGVEVKTLKARSLAAAAAHHQAVHLIPLLLFITASLLILTLLNILEGARKPAAGPKEEAIDAGAQDGPLLLVALVVEHAHPGVRLPTHSAFRRLDFELCRDCSFSFEDIILGGLILCRGGGGRVG